MTGSEAWASWAAMSAHTQGYATTTAFTGVKADLPSNAYGLSGASLMHKVTLH